MQPHKQFDGILEICMSFSPGFLNAHGNLQHCGRKPLCADVEIIALSLFQEFLSIDSECLFFDTLQSILPDFSIRKSYAKSQRGLFLKVISKVTLFTLLQYINYQEKRSLCQLRYTLSA